MGLMKINTGKPADWIARATVQVKTLFSSFLDNSSEIKIIRIRNLHGRNHEVYEVSLENREIGRHVRREFGLALKSTPCPIKAGIFVNNSITPGTQVRISIMKVCCLICLIYYPIPPSSNFLFHPQFLCLSVTSILSA